MATNTTPPIPQDEIKESFVWRDWFQRLSNRVYGTMSEQDASAVNVTGGVIQATSVTTDTLYVPTGTDGQVLIGKTSDHSFTPATLTAGTNITITNAPGSITIAAGGAGAGDVVGPASATDNAVARFDTTTGKLIQNSVVTVNDTGDVAGLLSEQFSDGTATTLAAGKMWYNGTTGSLNFGMGGGNITQQVGEETFMYGKASAAITDSPLQIIYHTGTVGASGVITFAPTIAGITNVNDIIGVATENIALNDFGRVTAFGVVRGITTNGTAFGQTWADDDVIWYDPVTGNPTNVAPVAPNIKVQIGTVISAGSGGSGSFQVLLRPGSVLGGTDSNVQFGTLANNNLIAYDSTLGYWKNVTASAIGLGTVTSVTGTSPVSVATGTTTPVISLASGYGDTQNPYASKTANYVLAAPNGSAGVPTFRAIVAADIPTLNQNTTGSAASLSATLVATSGGTGQSSYVIGDLLYASTTTALSKLADIATGNALISGGVGAAPSYGKIGLTTHVSGTLPLTSGGSGQITAQLGMNAFAGAVTSGSYLRGNGTNVVMNTIQVADVPTLNQNTTGSAATLTTARAIYGNNFNGSAALTQIIASTYGGTGNGFTKFTGATTTEKTYTLPDATATILTSNAAVTVGQGGTGQTTYTDGQLLIGNTTGNTLTKTTLTAGTGISITNGTGSISIASTVTGTVTSVTGTSPVVSSGGTTPAISLAASYGDTQNPYASKTANFVLAAPNGLAGVPTFRAVVAADIPTLNQNTTGSAATLTTGRTIAITGDLAYTSPSFNGSANVTAAGTLATVNTNVGSFTNATLTVNGKGLITAASSGTAPVTSVTGTAPVVSSGGATPAISMPAATTSVSGYLTSTDWTTFNNKGSGTVTAVSVVSANGFAGSSSGGATPALTLSTSITGVIKGNGTAISAATVGTDYSVGTSALATGILKSTTTTGALSIAVAADFPTLNQSTTGSAATLTTTRAIYGNNFDGSAALTQVIASTYGGTGNGFAKLSGPATTEKTFTLPNASATILTDNAAVTVLQGGTGATTASGARTNLGLVIGTDVLAPTGSAASLTSFPTFNQNTTGTAANVTGTVAIANGGTGQTTANTAFNALAPSQTTNSGKYLTTDGTDTSWATIAAGSNTTAFAFAWFLK